MTDRPVIKPADSASDFKIELKYIEAAIEALTIGKDEAEKERVRNFGNAILNVAMKTKQKIEGTNG